jgi:GTP-binding protein HflX
MLFSTLDPTIRKYTLPNNQNILLTDTVGFIYNLPHNLVEAFKATLEEVAEADILIHVLDASHPKIEQHSEATYQVLEELDIKDKPIITVLNKSDLIKDEIAMRGIMRGFGDAVIISALKKDNIAELIDRIMLHLGRQTASIKIKIPVKNMRLLNLIYTHGKVLKRVDKGVNVYIEAQVPQRVREKINYFLTQDDRVIE